MAAFAGQLDGTITDRAGNERSTVDYTVYEDDGVTPATVYADPEKSSTIANPLPTGVAQGDPGIDDEGNVVAYLDPALYVVAIDFESVERYRGPVSVRPDPRETPTGGGLSDIVVTDPEYGAVGDGTTDDTAAFVAAFAALNTQGRGRLVMPPGTYRIDCGQVFLPTNTLFTTGASYIIEGYGATIISRPNDTGALIGDNAAAITSGNMVAMLTRKVTVRGITFVGVAGAVVAGYGTPDVGLLLIAHYNAVVEDCHFQGCDQGLDVVFCLGGHALRCLATQNVTHDFRARSGLVTISGATATASGCNHFTFEKCRAYAKAGVTANFRIVDSSGVTLRDCITEGVAPVNAVHWTSDNATSVVKAFRIENHHFESTPSNAQVKTVAYGHHVYDQMWAAVPGMLVDASGTNNVAVIEVRSVPWVQSLPVFKDDGTPAYHKWVFRQCFAFGNAQGLWTGAAWDGGVLPRRMYVEGWAGDDAAPKLDGVGLTVDSAP